MQYDYEDNGTRAKLLNGVKRAVIKVGTRVLMDVKDVDPGERIRQLICQVDNLRKAGIEVVLVSSGAVGAGLLVLKTARRPKRISALQAHAAVGQCHLMRLYEEACSALGFHCAQLLLTAADLHDRERNIKVTQCLDELLANGVLPIINENDSVCVDEIKVGDNDTLAALVASLTRADLTILLTSIDGLRETLPDGTLGRRLSTVQQLTPEVLAMAHDTDGNPFSVGGMLTKLRAAKITCCCGEPLWIADGFAFDNLNRIFKGDDIGTVFLPTQLSRLHARQRFIAFFSEPAGTLIVDNGAQEAILKKGKSLLPSGIIGLRGIFSAGATVRIVNTSNQELARGIVSFDTAELSKICGESTEHLEAILGHKPPAVEAVHRNALVIYSI